MRPSSGTDAGTPGSEAQAPEPVPVGSRQRRRLLADITPLRENAEYRRLWAGSSLSMLGTQMTNVALPVQVYAITRSSFYVGLVGLAILVPLVLVGLLGGAVVDAVDRRKLALGTSTVLAASSASLAVQAFAGLHSIALLYLLAAVSGGVSALDSPARQTFVPRLLGRDQIPAATALGQISMQASLTGGPLLAGVLIGLSGVRAAYLVDALVRPERF